MAFVRFAGFVAMMAFCGSFSACAVEPSDSTSEVHLDSWYREKPTLRTVQFCAGTDLYTMPYFPEGRYRSISKDQRHIVDSVYFHFDFETGRVKSIEALKGMNRGATMALTHNVDAIITDGRVDCPRRPLDIFLSQSNIYNNFNKLTEKDDRGIDLAGCLNVPSEHVFCDVFGFVRANNKGRVVYFKCEFSGINTGTFQSYTCYYYLQSKVGAVEVRVFYYNDKGFDFLKRTFSFDKDKIYADAERASNWVARFDNTLVLVGN